MHIPIDPASGGIVNIPRIPDDVTSPLKRVPVPNMGTKVYARWTPPTPPPVPSPPGDDNSNGNSGDNGNSGNDDNNSSSSGSGHSSSTHTSSSSHSSGTPNSSSSSPGLSTIPLGGGQSTPSGALPDNTLNPSPSTVGGASSGKKSGLSPAIIGAIAGGIALVIFVIGFFVTRKWYMKRRAEKRVHNPTLGWSGAADEKKDPELGNPDSNRTSMTSSHWSYHGNNPDANSLATNSLGSKKSVTKKHARLGSVPSLKLNADTANKPGHRASASLSAPLKPLILVTPPDSTSPDLEELFPFNEPVAPPPAAVHPREDDTTGPYIPARMIRPFVRSMPDELNAKVGEKVGILKEYDDGWTLCVTLNPAGAALEPGMVPTECLEKLDGSSTQTSDSTTTSRASKRDSSLTGQPLRRDSLPATRK